MANNLSSRIDGIENNSNPVLIVKKSEEENKVVYPGEEVTFWRSCNSKTYQK